MIENYLLHIDRDMDTFEFNHLLNFVVPEKAERIQRFRRLEDKQRGLLGDILARYAIIKKTGVSNYKLVFGVNEYGKPLLLSPSGLHFSISHSGSWVACGVHDKPIGVDVEEIKQIDLLIAERFFSQEEHSALQAKPEELRLKYFYMLWTLKESYIKAEGKGLNIPLKSFTVNINNGNTSVKTGQEHLGPCFFHQFFPDDNHAFAICTYSDCACNTHLVNFENILDFISTLSL